MGRGLEKLLKELEADLDKTYLQGTDATKDQIDFYLKGKKIEFEKFKRALGEWAWNEYLYWKEPQSKAYSKLLAVACLGEDTVTGRITRRLK